MLRPFSFVLAALAFLAGAAPSQAQVFIVASCGTVPASQATLTAGNPGMYFVDTTGKLCVNATVSATATIAAFAPVGTNNAIAVTSTTARTALTGAAANSTTLVENSGATDVFVAFGDNTVTVTAANGTRVPAGWAIAFNIGAATNIAYITASSTSTINATTGTGLPALGAAGSGGSGGSVTQGTSPWVSSITVWGGGTLGAMANYGTTPGAVLVPGVNAFVTNTNANGQATMANSSPVAIASNQTAIPVTGSLGTSGGWTKKRLSALSTTVVAIKSSAAGQLGLLHCNNPNASIEYVQIFDVATAGGVTLNTTVPDLSFAVPASNATGFTLPLTGFQFANGIQIAATTTATGLTAPGTALDCNAGFN